MPCQISTSLPTSPGDFTFTKGANISRYFIVCTIIMKDCTIGNDLMALRRRLAWEKTSALGNYFHATADQQSIRDEVYDLIRDEDFTVQATIMEKSKAQPQVRESNERFYKYGWLYHFRHGIMSNAQKTDELLITTASVATRKAQGAFTDAVNDVVQQRISRSQWRTSSALARATRAYKLLTTAHGRSSGNGNAVINVLIS